MLNSTFKDLLEFTLRINNLKKTFKYVLTSNSKSVIINESSKTT